MLKGIVIYGEGLGRVLGFPTANLDCKVSDVKLRAGVYAARVKLNNKQYKAGLIVRFFPFKVEIHFLNYGGEDFYGNYLEVEPIQKVSEIEKYSSLQELAGKIKQDLILVKKVLEKD